MPPFVAFLADDAAPHLQVEAAWVITNVAAGTRRQTVAVARCGAVPPLVRLLHTAASQLLLSLVAWALANIARELRDEVLQHGALPAVLAVLAHHLATPREIRECASPRSEMVLCFHLCSRTRMPHKLTREPIFVYLKIRCI